MEIIDSQIHSPHPHLPIDGIDEQTRLAIDTELAREAIDSVGIDYAMVTDTDAFCEYAVKRYPDRFVSCPSFYDPSVPGLVETFAGLKETPGVLAVRTFLIDLSGGSTSYADRGHVLNAQYLSGAFEALFDAAERVDIPLCLFAFGQAQELDLIARAHPNLSIILDFLGTPQPPLWHINWDDPWWHLDTVNTLAKYENISIKFGAAHSLSKEAYPYHDVWPHLHKMIDAFGADRLMWGSDMTRLRFKPYSSVPGTRDEWVSTYADSLYYLRDTDEISATEKEKILGASFRRIFRWPKDA